jgi:hypothetical protein
VTTRRAFVRGAVGALAALTCDRNGDGQPVIGRGDPPLDALSRMSSDGRLSGCVIEYWVGGGQPPPHYRSDQFRLLTADGRDVMEVARPRYDVRVPPDAGPGYAVERARLAASRDDVRAVARAIVACGVFSRHFPEEQNPRVADILSTEVIVTVNSRAFSRRYFRRVPEALGPLRAEVERRVREVDARGQRGLFHQGRPLR